MQEGYLSRQQSFWAVLERHALAHGHSTLSGSTTVLNTGCEKDRYCNVSYAEELYHDRGTEALADQKDFGQESAEHWYVQAALDNTGCKEWLMRFFCSPQVFRGLHLLQQLSKLHLNHIYLSKAHDLSAGVAPAPSWALQGDTCMMLQRRH